jgi:signal transduction histidine kinase/ActR/RegA family two-component response regulator
MLTMALVGVAFGGLLVGLALWHGQERRALLSDEVHGLEFDARVLGERALKGLATADIALLGLAQLTERPPGDPAALRFLEQTIQSLPQLRLLWLADADGTMRHMSPERPLGPMLPMARTVIDAHRASDRDRELWPPLHDRMAGRPAFRVSRRVVDADGRLRAVAVAGLEPGFFADTSALPHRPDETVALVDGGGVVYAGRAGTTGESLEGRAAATVPMLAQVLASHGGHAEAGTVLIEGLAGAVAPLADHGLRIVVATSTERTLAAWRMNAVRDGLVALAVTLLVAVLIVYLRRAEAHARSSHAALARSERRLRTAIESMSDGLVLWDAQDRLVVRNESLAKHTVRAEDFEPGIAFPDLLRRRATLGIHQVTADQEADFIRSRVTERRQPDGHAIEYRLSNGQWIRCRSQPTPDGGVVSLYTDITAFKEAELRATLAEIRLRKAIDSMHDAWLLWDAEDRLELFNPAFAARALFPEDARIGIHYRDFMRLRLSRGWYPQSKGREEAFIDELIAERRSQLGRAVEYKRMDGRRFLSRSWITGDGGVVDLFTDITDMKRAEARATQAEMRLLDAIDATDDGWHIWDAEGRLALINRAALTMVPNPEDYPLGARFEDTLRTRIRRGHFPEANGREEEFIEQWAALRRRGERRTQEIQRPDGTWLLLREHPTGEGGVVAVLADITERKQWEEKLRAARDTAERANRAKSDFLSNMSHELRTPLNAVLGFSQLLLFEPGGDPLTPAQQEAAISIERTGRHLLDLVEEILDLSRIENSAVELTVETLSAADLCLQVAELMRPAAAAASVELLVAACDDLPRVSGDRKRALQVITNFVSNAIKYGASGERIEIGAMPVGEAEVRFAVTDFGPGISPDRQAELFRPFSRAGLERTNIEGTGIGLSIAKGLVERMNGRIGVDSGAGQGATFWFTLPARIKETIMTAPSNASPSGGGQGRGLESVGPATVLYVEDTPENLALMRRLLGRYANITYLEAESAELGLEIARRQRPDLILMDMRLPGMSGLEALKALRADPATAAIAVIGLTGAAMPHEADEINAAGFDGYITKPFRIAILLATLTEMLSRRQAAGPPERGP